MAVGLTLILKNCSAVCQLAEDIAQRALQAFIRPRVKTTSDSPVAAILFDALPTHGLKKDTHRFLPTNAKVLGVLRSEYQIVADVLNNVMRQD